MIILPVDGEHAASCLDGSPYAFYIIPGNPKFFSIGLHGGGWCYDEADCAARAQTQLGSSKQWNLTSCFHPPAFSCNGLPDDCTKVFLPYCDGSSFTSFRGKPWPINKPNPQNMTQLSFRGVNNLERTLDKLVADWGLGKASDVILSGGSAGGLSTYLHLDRVASRVPHAAVVGAPVAGYFTDQPPLGSMWRNRFANGDHPAARPMTSWPAQMQYAYTMYNSSGSLSKQCQSHYAPTGDEWKCFIAPYAQQFIVTPFFAIQSRFDEWQMGPGEGGIPCVTNQAFAPPYKRSGEWVCNATERAMIRAWGANTLKQFQPVLGSKKNGCFLVSCIQHGINAFIDGKVGNDSITQALTAWRTKTADNSRAGGYHFVDECGPHANGDEPCNPSKFCAPFN
jgi:hypothetical protein